MNDEQLAEGPAQDVGSEVEMSEQGGADGAPEAPTESPEDQGSETPFAGVAAPMARALKARGFESLTAVQEAIIETGRTGRDLQVSSQTGSGKTVGLGFVLFGAVVEGLENAGNARGPSVLVITPTRELGGQVRQELTWLYGELDGVGVASVTGGTPIFRDKAILQRGPQVLVGTPGRLLDHIRGGALDLSDVREVVLDEADQMLDMGFREDLEAILDAASGERRIHLVSATFPDGIQHLAQRYQTDPLFVQGTALGEANADIEHVGHLVKHYDRYAALVNHLLLASGTKTLVFVERRADAAELSQQLEADGFRALPISGDLVQSQRDRALAAFRSGKATILVATDVAARGIDVPDVGLVVQTSPPMDPETYTHRSGRTGRAGKTGRSLLFVPPQRRRHVDRLLNDAGVQLDWRPVPSAEEVEAHVEQENRSKLEARVERAVEKGASEVMKGLAGDLLEGKDPVELVACLLTALQPKRRAQAADVGAGGARREGGRDRDAAPSAKSMGGHVRFFMNYGANQGATPGRVVASLCRRGGVAGTDIGSISIHPNATTFDVSADVVDGFENQVSQRDPRDPNVFIRRDRGPAPGGRRGGARRGGGRRRGYGARRRR